MGIWDSFVDPLKKVADDTAAGYQASAPATAAPSAPVSPGPEGPLPELKYGPEDVPFAKPVIEPSTPVGEAPPLEAPTNFGTEAEFGSGSARTEQAGFPIQAPLASEVKGGAVGAGRVAAQMAVAPANINYAPVGGKDAFDTAYGELPATEQDALGAFHVATAEGLKAQAESKAEEANQLAQMAENIRLREERRSAALMDHVANYTRMADQMAAQRFDAGRYWKNPGNVLAAFSMSLLPLAGVAPEKALGLVDAAVQKDWQAQQIDYERAQNRAAAELSTIGQLRSIYGDERAAEDAFRAQSYKAMAAKAQSVALRGQSEEQRKLATLLASKYATEAAQAQARASATLYQGAHLAPAQLVGAQIREGEKTYTDPAVNALYGRKDQDLLPPAPGEAPGDNPATGIPDHPPTKEERNAAAAQAALARFRGVPVPPQAQAVLDASKRAASGAKELLSPLTSMLGIGGPDAEPETEAPVAASGTSSVTARARANLGLPPRAQGPSTAPSAKRMEAREIPDVESRTVVSAAERIYGGQLPNNLADKLAQKYGSKVTNIRPTDLTPDKKTGNLSPEVMAQLQKDIEYAKSERGLADQAYKNEETAARGGLVDAQKYSNQIVGIQAASDVNVPLKVVKVRSEGGRPIYDYALGHNGRPMLDDSVTPEQRKKYDAYFTKLTEESRKEIAEYEKRVDQKWKGEGYSWPVALRSARTQQQLLLKKFGGDPAKVDEALGFLRTGSLSVNGLEFDVQNMAQALRKIGVTATPDDILKYKRTMQALELKFSNILSGSAMSEKEIGRHRKVISYDAPFREQSLGTESELATANQALEDMKRSLSDTARAILNKREGVGYGRQATPAGAYSTPGLR